VSTTHILLVDIRTGMRTVHAHVRVASGQGSAEPEKCSEGDAGPAYLAIRSVVTVGFPQQDVRVEGEGVLRW
jgi:hypothetical protein